MPRAEVSAGTLQHAAPLTHEAHLHFLSNPHQKHPLQPSLLLMITQVVNASTP